MGSNWCDFQLSHKTCRFEHSGHSACFGFHRGVVITSAWFYVIQRSCSGHFSHIILQWNQQEKNISGSITLVKTQIALNVKWIFFGEIKTLFSRTCRQLRVFETKDLGIVSLYAGNLMHRRKVVNSVSNSKGKTKILTWLSEQGVICKVNNHKCKASQRKMICLRVR